MTITTIPVSKKFHDWLKNQGRKGESYEEVIKKLLKPEFKQELESVEDSKQEEVSSDDSHKESHESTDEEEDSQEPSSDEAKDSHESASDETPSF